MITRSIVLKIFKTISKKQLAKDASDKVEELLNKDLFPRIILISGKLANNKKINQEHVENAMFAITNNFEIINKYAKHTHTKIMSKQAIKKDALELLDKDKQKLSSKILVYLHNVFLYYIKSLVHVKTSDKKITEKHILNNLVLHPDLSYVFATESSAYWKTLAGTSIANVEIPESHIVKAADLPAPSAPPKMLNTQVYKGQNGSIQTEPIYKGPNGSIQTESKMLNTQVYKGPNRSIQTEPIYKGSSLPLPQAVNSFKIPQVSPANASQVAKAAQISKTLKEMQMSPELLPPKKIDNPWNSARNANKNTSKSMFDLVKNAENQNKIFKL